MSLQELAATSQAILRLLSLGQRQSREGGVERLCEVDLPAVTFPVTTLLCLFFQARGAEVVVRADAQNAGHGVDALCTVFHTSM